MPSFRCQKLNVVLRQTLDSTVPGSIDQPDVLNSARSLEFVAFVPFSIHIGILQDNGNSDLNVNLIPAIHKSQSLQQWHFRSYDVNQHPTETDV